VSAPAGTTPVPPAGRPLVTPRPPGRQDGLVRGDRGSGAAKPLPPQLADLGVAPELARRGVADEALVAIRAEIEAAALVEYRTLTLTGLIERFGTRYLERATLELVSAVEGLQVSGERRSVSVSRVAGELGLRRDATLAELIDAAPEPFAASLRGLRRELNATKRRIAAHAERNTDLLGRRMAIIAEAISGYPDGLPPLYGRPLPAVPRYVKGVL
jgi:hypothetical protein